MRKSVFALLATAVLCGPAYTQNVTVTGISLGMTVSEAESHLPGFILAPQKLPYPADFQLVYANKGSEFYALETVHGKLVFIDRQIFLPKGSEPDQHVYGEQVLAKYGPQSPGIDMSHGNGSGNFIPDPKGLRVGNMGWQFDGSGRQIPETDCPIRPYFPQVGGVALFDPSRKYEINSFMMVTTYSPKHTDYPGCHIHFDVLLERTSSYTPPEAIDHVEFRLYDPTPLYPVIEQLATAQKQKEDAAHKAITARQGPPM